MITAPGQATPTDPATRHALAELVRRHCRTFPWYADLLRERGLSESAPLEALPIIDEQFLDRHYYRVDRPDLAGATGYLTSGTTSGRRKRILYSADDHDRYIAQRRDLLGRFLRDIPAGSPAVADLGTGHAAASARRIFEDLGYRAYDIDFTRPVSEHVARLNEWRPAVLFTMPMVLDRILAAPIALTARPRKIVTVGDVAPANWRHHVADRFEIGFDDVLDVLGSIEVGAIAYYCAETSRYHFHDHVLPEVLNPTELYADCPVDLGAAGPGDGILLLTSFARQYFPVLRFVTNDVIRGLHRIRWGGRGVFAFDRVEGRFGGEVKHGERLSHHDICAALTDAVPGAPFEVRDAGQLEILVGLDELTPDQIAAIRAGLRATNPDVAQMIDSGLVGDIVVTAVGPQGLRSGGKRSFTVREA